MDNKVNHFLSFSFQSCIIDSLHENDLARFNVIGMSMQPIIQRSNWVIIKPYSESNHMKIGDIVLIKKMESFITHRIIQINEKSVITQGDWSSTIDPPNQFDDVLGKVVVIEKKRLVVDLNNPIIRFLDQLIFNLLRFNKIFYRKGQINGINKHSD